MNLFDYKHYYDTTNSPNTAKHERSCNKQETEILALFYAGQYVSQPSIRRAYLKRYNKELQIASCSRAFSNLTDLGKIEKTDCKVPGDFGRDVYTWIKITKEI